MTEKSLGELCSFLTGGTPSRTVPSYFEGEMPWITGADINSSVVTSARSRITPEAIKNSATNVVAAGTILLVTRTSVGKVAEAGMPLCFSQDITALVPRSDELDARYLLRYLEAQAGHFERSARGATIQGVAREAVESLRIPLPSIGEQRRIAAILDQAEALRAKRRQALAKLDTLTQSLFLQTNAGATTKPFTFQQIANFTTGKLDSNAAVVGGRFPFFTCAREDAAIDLPAFDCEALLLAGNNAAGEYSVKHFQGKFNAYQRTYVITLNGSLADYQYMRLALSAKLRELKHSSKGTGTKYLTLEILHRLKFHLPPLAVQRNLSAQLTVIDKQRGNNAHSEKSMNDLLNGLHQRAFRGEL